MAGRRQGAALPAAALLGAQAPSVIGELRFACGLLCVDGGDGTGRDGVNRPARRLLLAQAVLRRARDRLPRSAAQRRVEAAIDLLDSHAEEGAMREIDAALGAIGAAPR